MCEQNDKGHKTGHNSAVINQRQNKKKNKEVYQMNTAGT